MKPIVFVFWLAPLLLGSGCNCGGASPVFVNFEGFQQYSGGLFVVRWADPNGQERLGTRQSSGLTTAGTARFEFSLPTATQLRLQYWVDQNGNASWDGPIGTGEPSWDRETSLPAPIHNRDQIILTVGADTRFAAVPDDFTAP